LTILKYIHYKSDKLLLLNVHLIIRLQLHSELQNYCA